MTDKKQLKFKQKSEVLPNSQAKVTVTIDKEDFENLYKKSLKKVLENAEMEGFRKGHVPEKMFLQKNGEFPILQDMAYTAIDSTYVDVLVESKVKVIGAPKVDIAKLSKGDDFEYFIIVDVLPEITLGDYKKLQKIKEKAVESTTDAEVEKTIEEIRNMRKDKDGNLPEVNEEFLKTVGNFKDIEDFKKQIKENIDSEKKYKAEDARRVEIIETLISEAKGDMPETLVQNELQKIEDRMNADLSQMGTTVDGYLKMMKKDKTEWLNEQRAVAVKNSILQVALLQIAKDENIAVEKERLDAEVAHMLLHYPTLQEERLRAYSEERMTNSLVMEFLQNGKLPDQKEFFKVDHDHSHDEENH
jgi:FKBP-type peptidyl-prolyl cis-trans isomerase (trigger factor)